MEEVVPNWWYWKGLHVVGCALTFTVSALLLSFGVIYPATKDYKYERDALVVATAGPIGMAMFIVGLIRVGII